MIADPARVGYITSTDPSRSFDPGNFLSATPERDAEEPMIINKYFLYEINKLSSFNPSPSYLV
jgi:hypothetical protein